MSDFPKDFRENLEWRRGIYTRCAEDSEYRAKTIELYNRDVLFAFNGFFWTYDPRRRPYHQLPFATYEYEDELILELVEAVEGKRDLLVEKSRDMGVTWSVIATFYWFWSKKTGGYDFLLGSRKEDYVDKAGDPRTHFAKVRYLHYKLRRFLWPEGFNPRRHDNYMKFVNPATGAAITGESNNANFSTQGRYAAVLYDEFAKWESTDVAAWTAGGDATPCRIAVSTPFGAGGQYYNLAMDGKTRKLRYHWSRHPGKSEGLSCVWPPPNEGDEKRLGQSFVPEVKLVSPWYERECERRSELEVKQELDIDYLGSGNPVFDGRAMESLKFYLAVPEEVTVWVKIELDELGWEEVSEPFDPEGFLVVYRRRDPKCRYSIGVDVVEGVEGGDYAVISVLNRMTKDLDAVYWSRVDEVMLARVVKVVSDYYSHAEIAGATPWVGIETNGPGLATFDFAVLLGVSNLFMAPRYDVVKGGVTYKKGWRTDTNSRNELVSGIRNYLMDRAGRLNSHRLVGELMTFVRSRTGKPIAKEGCHDDMVMSFGVALQVDEIAPLDYEEVKEARREILSEKFVQISREEFRVDEPLTIQDRCLEQSLQRQIEKQETWDDLWDAAVEVFF